MGQSFPRSFTVRIFIFTAPDLGSMIQEGISTFPVPPPSMHHQCSFFIVNSIINRSHRRKSHEKVRKKLLKIYLTKLFPDADENTGGKHE